MLFYKSVFWQAILYQYLYFLCFSLLNPKEEKTVDATSCCVTILTRAASNLKKCWGADAAFTGSLRQFSSPSDKPWRSQQKCWRPIIIVQHWSYEEVKPFNLHQFLSFCLARKAGSCTPSTDLTQRRHLTCEPAWNIFCKFTHSCECTETFYCFVLFCFVFNCFCLFFKNRISSARFRGLN